MVRPSTPHMLQHELLKNASYHQPTKSKVPHFYLNKSIEQYSSKSSTPISLKHLINFGKHGRNKGEKEEGEKLLKGGNFLRSELPIRLSHRLRDLQTLPYVVTSNPRMELVYELYLDAFDKIRKFPPLKDLDDNDKFCDFMKTKLSRHKVIIPNLAMGISESSPVHLPPRDLDNFMTRMLRSRISRRVITEQHIALTSQFRGRQSRRQEAKDRDTDSRKDPMFDCAIDRKVGIVDTMMNAADIVKSCKGILERMGGPEGTVPVQLDGELNTTFAYISEHLEFILFELIRNAAHATVKIHGATNAKNYPITATIVHGTREVAIRISDQGGGIPPWGGLPPSLEVSPSTLLGTAVPIPLLPPLSAQRLDIFSFSHMRRYYMHHRGAEDLGVMALRAVEKLAGTLGEQFEDMSVGSDSESTELDATALMKAQMKSGIGLPLAKMFAEYFRGQAASGEAGSLDMYTVNGHGSDALLKLPKFGSAV